MQTILKSCLVGASGLNLAPVSIERDFEWWLLLSSLSAEEDKGSSFRTPVIISGVQSGPHGYGGAPSMRGFLFSFVVLKERRNCTTSVLSFDVGGCLGFLI